MQRDIKRLTTTTFDLIIVGGGIYGASAAWEASLRGLSVALLEQADFGGATSANSQKIIHGGLRYLQSLDLPRMRQSIRERRTLLRIAPHLVRPMPVLVPTRGLGLRSRAAFSAALAANELLSFDRNRGIADDTRHIASGRLLSRKECLRLAPFLRGTPVSGAALWHDAQALNSERLTLAFVQSAAGAGAVAANYVEATGLLTQGRSVTGVRITDRLTGQRHEVRGRMVLNTRGPWTEPFLSSLNGHGRKKPARWLKAVGLVLEPLLMQNVAVGIESPAAARLGAGLLFITPWEEQTIIGTAYLPFHGDPSSCQATEADIKAILKAVNAALPSVALKRHHVRFAYAGLIPADESKPSAAAAHYKLIDHEREHGLTGLISAVGVKYTTARDVAEKTVAQVCIKLGRGSALGRSRTEPLFGSPPASVKHLLDQSMRARLWGLDGAVIQRLVHLYGTAYTAVLKLIRENLAWREPVDGTRLVLKAEVVHAIRQEMAQTLADVVFRRTGLGAGGFPGAETIRCCAEVMAGELNWDEARYADELRAVEAVFARHGWHAPAAAAVAEEVPVG